MPSAISSQNIYTMESANMICGDTSNKMAPGISTHLSLQELKLPTLEEATVDHNAGGAWVGIEIPTHMNKLEATFNLAGWDPDIMTFLGQNSRWFQRFTAYGLIRDRRTGRALQSTAVIEGRLARINPTAFSKGGLQHHEYGIKSIVQYQLLMQLEANGIPEEIYFWDFFTSVFRVAGDDINRDMVRLLSIPGNPVDVPSDVGNGPPAAAPAAGEAV